jgi:hypothetical protein
MKDDITEKFMRDMAKRCIENKTTFEYMLFWLRESKGWQKKARKVLLEELKKQKSPKNIENS